MSESKKLLSSVHVLTLNCWGLKYLAVHRNERLAQIGYEIAHVEPAPEIVGLQECWTQEDYEAIRSATAEILPYGKFYYGGCFGAGLAILSKWPIEESSMVAYPLNGRPTAFFRGDWFVGKGIACARIRMGEGNGPRAIAEVFCTHLHAPYEREPNDSYLCHRTAQAWEIAKLMRGAAERGHLVLGLGDFNMIPLSLAHRIITAHAPVQDVWRILHPDSSIGAAIDEVEIARGKPTPSVRFNLLENGATCDSILNTWRWNEEHKRTAKKGLEVRIEPDEDDSKAKRLDYIFFGSGALGRWRLSSAKVGMTDRHPTLNCSLSDHFSVEATLTWDDSLTPAPESNANEAEAQLPQPPQVQVGDKKSSVVIPWQTPEKPPLLPRAVYDDILEVTKSYIQRERRQRRLRLGHFIIQFWVSIGCFVAVWWSPRNFVAFLLMLLSSLGLAAGVIDGLIGGLFVSAELRALKEFEWEVRNARERQSST
jgi:sphingomyelin phosphodiesterase 2